MRCPFCKTDEDRVIDSRSIGEGSAIRRRRKCLACGKRFTTYERAEVAPIRVVKKDQSRESFKREKVLKGLTRASEKRSISTEQLESIVSKVESRIAEEHDSEVSTKLIGEMVIQELREVDHVGVRALRFGVPRVQGRGAVPPGGRLPRSTGGPRESRRGSSRSGRVAARGLAATATRHFARPEHHGCPRIWAVPSWTRPAWMRRGSRRRRTEGRREVDLLVARRTEEKRLVVRSTSCI